MTVTLGAYTLCDGATRAQDKYAGPVGQMSVTRAGQTQPVQRIRAAQARVVSRGNRLETYTLSVVRVCASAAAAAAHIAGMPAAVPASGVLTLGSTAAGTAVCDFAAEQRGAAVYVTWQLTCGATP